MSQPKTRSNLVLAAMIFAVGMTFIDMTIVSIASREIQTDLGLSTTGIEWLVNGYLLSLSASFALGGRLADTLGRRRLVTVGVLVFAAASLACGFTPPGSIAEAWIIAARVVQGFGAALMIPAAISLVVGAFPIEGRGRALAIFFGITGALTSVGPLAGGYLLEISWRTIFWINIPIALIALLLIALAEADEKPAPQSIDWLGAALVTGGMAFSVLGLQQSSAWGWSSPQLIGCLALGTLLLAAFVRRELSTESPLIRVRIFSDRAFAAQCVVLFLLMIVFVPLFFFMSNYAQISLGDSPSNAGFYLLYFFLGFAVAAQWGGRILDKRGAKPAVTVGAAMAAAGFWLWSGKILVLDSGSQWWWIVLAGAGVGMVLGPSNTDALNRAPASQYGEATGITQTVRNYGSSLGMAILGTVLIEQNKAHFAHGMRPPEAWAHSMQTILIAMAVIMAVIAVFAALFVPAGKTDEVVAEGTYDS